MHQSDDPLFPFHVEHVIAKQHGGRDILGNRALACHEDNLHRGRT
jgi:hypothetical protein